MIHTNNSDRRFLRARNFDHEAAYKHLESRVNMRRQRQLCQKYDQMTIEEFEQARQLVRLLCATKRSLGDLPLTISSVSALDRTCREEGATNLRD